MTFTDTHLLESGSGALKGEDTNIRVLESYGVTPPTSYSDDFNRADGALGTPWVVVEGALAITSNKVTAPTGAGPHTSRYNQTFTDNQWAEADVAGASAGGHALGPAVHINGTDLYYVWLGNATNTIEVTRRVGGSYTTIGSAVPCPPSFKAALEISGTTIKAYVDGTAVITITDSSITTGQPGILGNDGTTPTLDNFRCGSGAYPGPPPTSPFVVAATASTLGPGALSVNKPAGGQTGDYYVVWYQVGDYLSGGTIPNPAISGFTLEPGGIKFINNQAAAYLWKPYSGSEGATFDITGTDSSHWSGEICYLVRGLPAGWKPATSHMGSQGSGTPISINNVYVPASTLILISHKDWNGSPPTSVPAAWTQVVQVTAHTGYTWTPAAGYTGKSTVIGTFGGGRQMDSVLYSNMPIVFTDDFNRPDTDKIDGGANGDGLGGEWTAPSWGIVSNTNKRIGGNDFSSMNHDLGTQDIWCEADVTPNAYSGGAGGYGVINLRGTGAFDQAVLMGFWAPDGRWVIGSNFGGYHDLASTSSGAVTYPLHLRFEAQGTTARLYSSGVLVQTYTGGDIVAGGNFAGFNAGPEVSVDNYRCGPLPYTAP